MPLTSTRAWGTLAAQLPKGFGGNVDGEPKSANNGAKPTTTGEGKKSFWERLSRPSGDGGGSGGGGLKGSGGGGKGGNEYDHLKFIAAAGLGSLALLTLLYSGRIDGKEISWQEFRNEYLAVGLVDHLEVVNRDHVRVYLRSSPDPEFVHAAQTLDGMVPDDNTDRAVTKGRVDAGTRFLYFKIGSVETFERQLEDAQIDLHVRPRNFVLMRHKTETDLATRVSSILPSLLMVAVFIAGISMLSGSMGAMGGGGGKDGIGKMFSIGKARPAVVNKNAKTKVFFKDVAGCDEAKVEIMEFIQFLKVGCGILRQGRICRPGL